MKYDFVFKLNGVELYRNRRWPDTPEGINQKNFRKRVKIWAKLADLHGTDVLRHPSTCTAEERYNLVTRVLENVSDKQQKKRYELNHTAFVSIIVRTVFAVLHSAAYESN